MKQYFYIIFTVFLVISCGKINKRAVEGHVMNPITGLPIEGVQMSLVKTTNGLPGGEKTIGSAITDANGYYKIEEKSMKAVYLQVNTFGNYHPIGWFKDGSYSGGNNFPIEKGDVQTVDFHAVPFGEMKYTIKNVSCFDESDTLFLTRRYQLANTFYKDNLNKSQYIGCFQYVGQVYSKYPMGWHYIDGYYKKNNVITTFKDSIFINENQQYEWIFEY